MTTTTGYIKLFRQITEKEDYYDGKFDRIHAWIDLLLLANWETSTVSIRGISTRIERGQLAKSIAWLSDRWHWSKSTVISFLRSLAADGQIHIETNNVINIITIENYEKYQDNEEVTNFCTASTADSTANSTAELEKVSPIPPLKEEDYTEKKNQEGKRNIINDITKKSLFDRKEQFKQLIAPFVGKRYDRTICNDFYAYWTQVDAKSGLMRFEQQKQFFVSKRLAYFKRRQNE